MAYYLLVGLLGFYFIRWYLFFKNKSYLKIKSLNNFFQRCLFVFIDLFGFIFLFNQALGVYDLKWPVQSLGLQILGLFLFTHGIIFSSWARIWLGTEWDTAGAGCIKQDHHLITTGPFAFCRHPIYSNTWLLFIGWQLALNSCFILGALVLAWLINWEARREELILEDFFGQTYLTYQQQVPRFF